MAGRGDNNKHGSAGRGSSDQSNQPLTSDNREHPASDHNRREPGERRVEINVDMIPYSLKITPYKFNNEIRYYVNYDGSDDILFAWDNTVGHFAAFGDKAATMPDNVELAIAEKLQQMMKKDLVK